MTRIVLSSLAGGLALLTSAVAPATAGLWDTVKGTLEGVKGDIAPSDPTNTGDELTLNEIAWGLREALAVGAKNAVSQASAVGGFLDDPAIRIPLPDRLQTAAGMLRRIGMGSQADEFERVLNRSAEQAAAEAYPIFAEAITKLTFQDVHQIWQGKDDAATEYLREKTWDQLDERFRPVVHAASMEVGVTRAYQSLVGRPEIAAFVTGSDLDLDHFVTEKTLDGVFHLLAGEEQRIRSEPVARTTDLLKRVFGQQPASTQ